MVHVDMNSPKIIQVDTYRPQNDENDVPPFQTAQFDEVLPHPRVLFDTFPNQINNIVSIGVEIAPWSN